MSWRICCQIQRISIRIPFAWGNEDTRDILSILKEKDVHVTFFMTGGWVSSYPEDVKAIAAAGHDLGNHSENHKQMSRLDRSSSQKELASVHAKVKELTGVTMTLFRPPYGDYNNTLIEAAESLSYQTIQWDVDSLDWKNYGTDAIIKTVLSHKHLGNGSIILCHNGAKYSKEALPALIDGLKKKGYQIVPVSQLIYKDHYQMDSEGCQIPEHKKES